jgi:hypothetical protein
MRNAQLLMVLAAAGTALSLATSASAQRVVNVSGATLLQNLCTAPAITNDYIDINNDAVALYLNPGVFVTGLQLANTGVNPSSYYSVNYMATGSLAGLQELINFGTTPTSNPADVPVATRSVAFWSRQQYITNSALTGGGPGNAANFGGAPGAQTSASDVSFVSTGGVYRNDIAPLDVPVNWCITRAGTLLSVPLPTRTPGVSGYGDNGAKLLDKAGNVLGSSSNKLAFLTPTAGASGPANLYDGNPANANNRTIFETQLVYAPIGAAVSYGVGRETATMTELRHLFVTGRMPSGENLVAVTRESTSGTRNAFMNSIGIDPSWGVGENIGDPAGFQGQSGTTAGSQLGAAFIPGAKTGSGDVEATMYNIRLGIGYIGAERGVSSNSAQGWLKGGSAGQPRFDILGVTHDAPGLGGTSPSRPTITNILNGNPATGGYSIGGPGVIATMGDPRSAPALKGGYGWNASVTGENGAAPATPAMPSVEAAALVNNITRSITAFSTQGSNATFFTPAEFLASSFIFTSAPDYVHSSTNPSQMVPSTIQIASNKTYAQNNSVYRTSANPEYGTFGVNGRNGRVPQRAALASGTYSDGVAGGANYIDQGGVAINYSVNFPTSGTQVALKARNRIAGDFNGDGLRDLNDAADMIAAWKQRNGGPVWIAPAYTGPNPGSAADNDGLRACIEIIGDYNGDGNFNSEDVRYWADGLAIDPATGKLNRKKGFKAVDDAFAGNFFGVTLATAKPYVNGDSRGDIAGASIKNTPGWTPKGDGVINAKDIDYVFKQFQTNPAAVTVPGVGRQIDWSNLEQARSADLSADINGDLKIDQNDINELVVGILKTKLGDVNLDGVVNAADLALAQGNLGQTGLGWAGGDVNGDGVVDALDIAIIQSNIGAQCGLADIATLGGTVGPDGQLTADDLILFLSAFFNNDPISDVGGLGGSVGADGAYTVDDLILFLNRFFAGCGG